MRSLTIAFAATAALAGSATAQHADIRPFQNLTRPASDRCNPTAGVVDYRRKMPRSTKLGDQPPASQLYAVYNVVDGCPQPVVLRKGIGGNPQNAAPVLRTPPRVTTATGAQ